MYNIHVYLWKSVIMAKLRGDWEYTFVEGFQMAEKKTGKKRVHEDPPPLYFKTPPVIWPWFAN